MVRDITALLGRRQGDYRVVRSINLAHVAASYGLESLPRLSDHGSPSALRSPTSPGPALQEASWPCCALRCDADRKRLPPPARDPLDGSPKVNDARPPVVTKLAHLPANRATEMLLRPGALSPEPTECDSVSTAPPRISSRATAGVGTPRDSNCSGSDGSEHEHSDTASVCSEDSARDDDSDWTDWWATLRSCLRVGRPCQICQRMRRRRMVFEGLKARVESKNGGPRPQRLPDQTWVTAKYWGITWQQLQRYYRKCRADPRWSDLDSVADFVPKFVKPLTDGTGMGLALLKNQHEPKQVTLMVSHAWQENAKEFFEDVLEHMYPFEVAYICFLSNYQGSKEEIDAQLGDDISRSPFTEVLSSFHCKRLLVVPNETLRLNGQGLYSRLWCDWEIKVAADKGLPIHLTHRCSLDHLLGEDGESCGSSRNARCGNPCLPPNEDEVMIREAIESRPVVNGKFQSIGVFFFSICVAYGPHLAVDTFGENTWIWLLGYPGGIAIGFLLLYGIVWPARSLWYNYREHDGYRKLDSIIKAAARREYSNRRFRPYFDLPVLSIFSIFTGCIAFWRTRNEPAMHCDEIFFAIVEGLSYGVVGYPVLNINSMGPWTGVFILRTKYRILAVLYLAGMIAFGSRAMQEVLKRDGQGQGCAWFLLLGLLTLSLFHRRWKHALGLAVALGYMVFTYYVMLWHESWLLWRDTLLIVFGATGVALVPRLTWKQQLACCIICPGFVVGRTVLSILTPDIDVLETCKGQLR